MIITKVKKKVEVGDLNNSFYLHKVFKTTDHQCQVSQFKEIKINYKKYNGHLKSEEKKIKNICKNYVPKCMLQSPQQPRGRWSEYSSFIYHYVEINMFKHHLN